MENLFIQWKCLTFQIRQGGFQVGTYKTNFKVPKYQVSYFEFTGPDLQTKLKFPLISTPKGVLAIQKRGKHLYDLVRFECNGRNLTSCSWEFVQPLQEGVINDEWFLSERWWKSKRQAVIPLPDSYDLCT